MKILSIGNSFSQDAQRYLHALAKKEGVNIKAVNLYIPSCTLRTHYLNMLSGDAAYSFEFNGERTGIKVSLTEALASDDWDYVTLQQASVKSGIFDTYTPYLEALYDLVKEYCPKAKVLLHETWAYEEGSQKITENTPFKTSEEMYNALHSAYEKASELISADGIIPSGTALRLAVKAGIEKSHRDAIHVSYGAGRYLLALCWYSYLTGNDIENNSFSDFDQEVNEKEREIVIRAVKDALK